MSVPTGWKPERAVEAKIRDIQKRIHSRWIENPKGRSRQKLGIKKKPNQKEKHDCWSIPTRKHYVSVYKWRLLPDLWLMSFIPKKVFTSQSTVTSYRASPQQWFDSSLMILSPMKVAEWLYFDVGPTPTYPSSLISSSYIQSYSYVIIQVVLLYIHSYFHAYKHSCIYNMHTISFIHDCMIYPESYFNCITKCPQCVWSSDITNQYFPSVSYYKQAAYKYIQFSRMSS